MDLNSILIGSENPEPGRLIWNIETPDVKSEFDRLVEAGAVVIREPYDLGDAGNEAQVCTLADPDNNYFQLVTPMS